jgi:hypothetical protein
MGPGSFYHKGRLSSIRFPGNEIPEQVKPGDRVVIRSNYLVLSRLFGVVMKFSQLLPNEGK